MARRRVKKRTHVGANLKPGEQPTKKSMDRSPKSMVIRIGAAEVGPSVSQLVKDMRMVMQPDTAARLKERRNNKLRDYVTMTGPLGVTHLMLFSRSTAGNTNMRLAITPRGPTLHFQVENYSLCKDIFQSQKHPTSASTLYLRAPLLVMNNFMTPTAPAADGADEDAAKPEKPAIPKHLEQLVTTVFQSLYPPLSPQNTPLNSIKRVLLLNREPATDPSNSAYTITLRHYAISTRSTGQSKAIKRLQRADSVSSGGSGAAAKGKKGKGLPNLGKLEDVSEWMLDPSAAGYTSASESEAETDAEVEVLATKTRKLPGQRDRKKREEIRTTGVEKRAVKLIEIGPRMRLRLVKVEEGLCEGKVMWHEFVHLTKEEQLKQDKAWERKRKEKEERKKVQMENLERKRAEKGTDGKKAEVEDDEEEDEEDDGFWDSDDLEYHGVNDDEDEDDGFEDVEEDEDEEMADAE